MEVRKLMMNRRGLFAAGAAVAFGLGGAALWWARRRAGGPVALNARATTGDLPVTDPLADAWRRAPAVKAETLAQQMAIPYLKAPTIKQVTVRSLWNGSQLGLQVEWQDPQANDLESIDRFRDSVAIMLPMSPEADRPPVFMGMAGKPVYILHWKASWQRDIEKGFQDVEHAYPNWFNDVYPGHATLEQLGMTQQAAQIFYPGLSAGNGLSQRSRPTPVEELTAEGFGTLTPLGQQRSMGRGIYEGGRWKVSLGVPSQGPDLPVLKSGMTLPLALAVWEGGNQQRGGRKHYVDWIDLTLP